MRVRIYVCMYMPTYIDASRHIAACICMYLFAACMCMYVKSTYTQPRQVHTVYTDVMCIMHRGVVMH